MMNDSRRPHDATSPDGSDTALETRLHRYFAARANQPPDQDMLWQRLAPHLDARDHPIPADHVAAPPRWRAPRIQQLVRSPTIQPRASRARRAVSGALALAAVVLISLAAFALLHQRSPLRPASGQTIQRGQLIWHQIALPPGVILSNGSGVIETSNTGTTSGHATSAPTPNANLAVASANGAVAYICETPTRGTARVWRTTNAGITWLALPDVPGSNGSTECAVQVDGNNALTAMVALSRAPSPGGVGPVSQIAVLVAGATAWQPTGQFMRSFSGWDGEYFGITTGATPQSVSHLYRSTDGMRTWHKVDAPLIAESLATAKRLKDQGTGGVAEVWVQPVTGELLAQTVDGVLWSSADRGQTWASIALPALPPASELTPAPGETQFTVKPGAAVVVVGAPVANRPFTLCALVLDQTLTVLNVAPLYCSTDSGQTWVRRPRPAVSVTSGKPAQFELPDAMLADGSLLAWDVQTLYALPGNNTQALAAHALGTIPSPPDPNSIPAGMLGVTPDGAVFWQPQDPRTVYVAQYTLPAAPASTTPVSQP